MSHTRKKILAALLGALAALLLGGVALAVGYWLVVPKMAEDALNAKLVSLERDAGLTFETARVRPDGMRGVTIEGFKLIDPDASDAQSRELLTIETLSVGLDRARLLTGDKIVSSLVVRDATLRVHRDSAGQVNLERLLSAFKASRKARAEERGEQEQSESLGPLRHFGGVWPDLEIERAQVLFSSNAEPFPLEKMSLEKARLDSSGDRAELHTEIALQAADGASDAFVLPGLIAAHGELAVPLTQSSVELKFDRPLTIARLPFLPFLSLGLSEVALKPGGQIAVEQIAVAERDEQSGRAEPLFKASLMEISLERFTTDLSAIRPLAVTLHDPVAHLDYDPLGASNLERLLDRIKLEMSSGDSSSDGEVLKTAPQDKPGAQGGTLSDQEDAKRPSMLDRLKRLDLVAIAARLPERVDIRDAAVMVSDRREHDLVRAERQLELRDGQLKFEHDAEAGALKVEASFEARAGEEGASDRGGARLEIAGNYKTQMLKASATARALDLSWLAQMGGARLASHLKGGTLRASFELERGSNKAPLRFEGDVSIEGGHLEWARLAEEPLIDWSVGYDFEGYYDPRAAIPEPTLLETELDANVPEDPDQIGRSKRRITEAPPTQGALVFTRGRARSGGVEMELRPALYGLDRTKPLPARLDLKAKLSPTPIQSLLDATPDALLGALSEAKIDGAVKMDFELEVPLYDASNMIWRGEPEAINASIVSLPEEVDVRQMTRAFEHTIVDQKVLYERHITIPEMQIVPTDWLVENAGLTSAQIERHWESGGWARVSEGVVERDGRWRTASKPWGRSREDERVKRSWQPQRAGEPMVSAPYGPYQFVPLQHISRWMGRAIFTTEDNSFFKHDGFNRLALRQSVERNLAEGDYVRGASTISMQLIKNLYLSRKKVMARKIQEALLVWMTESVVRVPKARMLEVYLNIIEFAPGVFGIHDASVHYFGKRPDELTLAECAWLVTIVPGPKRYHGHYTRGEMSDSAFERIKRYMAIMHARGRVTEEELLAASAEKPKFFKPELNAYALAPRVAESPPVNSLEALFPELFGLPTGAAVRQAPQGGALGAPPSPGAATPTHTNTQEEASVPRLDRAPTPPERPYNRARPDPVPPTYRATDPL